jgi:hypothetical protein
MYTAIEEPWRRACLYIDTHGVPKTNFHIPEPENTQIGQYIDIGIDFFSYRNTFSY